MLPLKSVKYPKTLKEFGYENVLRPTNQIFRPFLVALGNKYQPPALNIALACFKYRATCFKYRPPLITSLVYHSSYHLPTLSKNFTSTTPPIPKKGYHVRYHPPFTVARRIIWHFYYTLTFPPEN